MSIILSPQAEEDFSDILQYTLQKWGEDQAYAYRGIIDKALLSIQRHPYIGRSHPDLSPAHRINTSGGQPSHYLQDRR